jgi:hypothetical protein
MADDPEFDDEEIAELRQKLDEILACGDAEIVSLVEEVLDEAYETVAHGTALPADWMLRVMTRLHAIQAKNENSDN